MVGIGVSKRGIGLVPRIILLAISGVLVLGVAVGFGLAALLNWLRAHSHPAAGVVGLVLKEWNNAGRRPVGVLSLGCVVIIIAANIVGLGMAN